MARNKQAMKRHRQNLKRRARNRHYRSTMRTSIKKVRKAASAGDSGQAKKAFLEAMRLIDKVSGKGIVHKNKAARTKSRLARLVQSVESS